MNEVILNKPNWLGSEVGLTLKSYTIPADFAPTVIKNGKTIVESGTIFEDAVTGQKGLVFGDYDITDGPVIASIMIGGRYIDEKLPASAASVKDDFIAQGLYAYSESEVVRPDFGDAADAPVPVVRSTEIELDGVADTLVFETNELKTPVSSTVTACRLNMNTPVTIVGTPKLYSFWGGVWVEYGTLAVDETDASIVVVTIKASETTAPAVPVEIPLKILAGTFINETLTPNEEIRATLNIVSEE